MESIYFSKENFKRIYKILYANFKKNYHFSIKHRPKYKQKIIDIMKFVYSNRDSYNIPDNLSDENKSVYLTQKLINIVIFYESQNHSPVEDIDNSSSSLPTNQLTSLRPKMSNKNTNGTIENNLNALLESRKSNTPKMPEIDFTLGNSEFNNVSIQDKYSEITKQRETDYDNFSRPLQGEPEMKTGGKNVFEHMNMTPDNVDLDDVLGDYQLLDNAEENSVPVLQSHYLSDENTNIVEPLSSGMVATNIDDIGTNIIKTPKKEANQLSYIKFQTVIIDCLAKRSSLLDSPRVIEFKDTTSANELGAARVHTNGGALIRDGWSNVESVEIKRVIIKESDAVVGGLKRPFLLVTSDTLPSNITASEQLPGNVMAFLYHDSDSSSECQHYINKDKHIQIFEKSTEAFMNRISLDIETENGIWDSNHQSFNDKCKLIITLGIRVANKFDN